MTTEPMPISKLRLRCRRGMLELDLILQRYLNHHYPSAPPREQSQFLELLELQDPELYPLVTGATPPSTEHRSLIEKITQPATKR